MDRSIDLTAADGQPKFHGAPSGLKVQGSSFYFRKNMVFQTCTVLRRMVRVIMLSICRQVYVMGSLKWDIVSYIMRRILSYTLTPPLKCQSSL